ncbi:MAG: RNA chaperone Hfq [Clostridiales bacterium]|nr:RNA chaperone Hfq [Clostridiales bacterium]
MTSSSSDLQDHFLNSLRKESIPATFFLVNGFQLKGTISAFDIFTLVINADGKQQMVYKHAISTIIPTRALDLNKER